jgi:hypothetical protein
VSDQPRRLTAEQVLALKSPSTVSSPAGPVSPLQPRKQAQRAALVRAVRVLEDRVFAGGWELRVTGE